MCVGCQETYDDDPYLLDNNGFLIKTLEELKQHFEIITVTISKCMNEELNFSNWDKYIDGEIELPCPNDEAIQYAKDFLGYTTQEDWDSIYEGRESTIKA